MIVLNQRLVKCLRHALLNSCLGRLDIVFESKMVEHSLMEFSVKHIDKLRVSSKLFYL